MSLRKRILLITVITVSLMIGVLYVSSHFILKYGVQVHEIEHVEENVLLASEAVNAAVWNHDILAYDWSAWDDTCEFMQEWDDDYLESNITAQFFISTGISYILYVTTDAEVYYSTGYDIENEEYIEVPDSILDKIVIDSPFLALDLEDSRKGLLDTPEGSVLFSARTIMTSNEEGPAQGTLIFAGYFTDSIIESMHQRTHLDIELARVDSGDLDPVFANALASINEVEPMYVKPVDDKIINGFTVMNDIYGNPALLVKVSMPRTAYIMAQTNKAHFAWLIIGIGTILCIVMILYQEKLVLSRITQFQRTFEEIISSGDLSRRFEISGSDELTDLGDEINRTLESLERTGFALSAKTREMENIVE